MSPISPGVMLIKTPQGEAELAVSEQGLIIGAMIRGKGEQGLFALKKILDWKSGIYAFFAEADYPSDHLKKALRMDIINIVKGIEGEDASRATQSSPTPKESPAQATTPASSGTDFTPPAPADKGLTAASADSPPNPTHAQGSPAAQPSNEVSQLSGSQPIAPGSERLPAPQYRHIPQPPNYTPLPNVAPGTIPPYDAADLTADAFGSKPKRRKFVSTNFAMDVFDESSLKKPESGAAAETPVVEPTQDLMQSFSDLNRLGAQASANAQARRTINAPPIELPPTPSATPSINNSQTPPVTQTSIPAPQAQPVVTSQASASPVSPTTESLPPTSDRQKAGPNLVTSTLLEGPVLTAELLADGPLTIDLPVVSLPVPEREVEPEVMPPQIVAPTAETPQEPAFPDVVSVASNAPAVPTASTSPASPMNTKERHTQTLLEGPILTPELLAEGALTQPGPEVFSNPSTLLDSSLGGYAPPPDVSYSSGSFPAASAAGGPGYVSGGFPAVSASATAPGFASGAFATGPAGLGGGGGSSSSPGTGVSTSDFDSEDSTDSGAAQTPSAPIPSTIGATEKSSPANALAQMASFSADDDDETISATPTQPAKENPLKATAGTSILEAVRKSKAQTGSSSTVPEPVPSVLRVPSILSKTGTSAAKVSLGTGSGDVDDPGITETAASSATKRAPAEATAVPLPEPIPATSGGASRLLSAAQTAATAETNEEQDPAALAALARLERFRTDKSEKPGGSTFGNLDEMVASQRLRQSEALGLPTDVASSPDILLRAKAENEAASALPAVNVTRARMRSLDAEQPPPAVQEIKIPPVVKKFKMVFVIAGGVAALLLVLVLVLAGFKLMLSGDVHQTVPGGSAPNAVNVKPLVPGQ